MLFKGMAARISDIFVSKITKIRNSKNIAVAPDAVSPVDKVRSIFATLKFYLTICGLYCEGCGCTDRKSRKITERVVIVVTTVNSYLFLCSAWLNQIRLIPILVKEGEYSPAMMVTLLLFFAYLSLSWGFTCWMFLVHRHYERVVQTLQSVTKTHRFSFLLRHFVFFINLSIFMSFVFPIYSCVSLFNDPRSLMTEIRLTPAKPGTAFWDFMKYFYTYYALMAYTHFVCFTVFQTVICCILRREFQDVAEKIQALVKKQDEVWEEGELEKLRLRHKDICHATMVADRLVSWIVLGVYVTGILIACFCVSCLSHGSYPRSELPTLFAVSVACIGQAVFTSVLGAMLNHQAHRPHEILTRIKTPNLTRSDYRSMLIFLTQVSGSDIGITAIGMFTVNKPAILTILGTVITYAVIIQQLHVSAGTDTGHQENTTIRSI